MRLNWSEIMHIDILSLLFQEELLDRIYVSFHSTAIELPSELDELSTQAPDSPLLYSVNQPLRIFILSRIHQLSLYFLNKFIGRWVILSHFIQRNEGIIILLSLFRLRLGSCLGEGTPRSDPPTEIVCHPY